MSKTTAQIFAEAVEHFNANAADEAFDLFNQVTGLNCVSQTIKFNSSYDHHDDPRESKIIQSMIN